MDFAQRRRFPRYDVADIQGSLDGQPCRLLRLGLGGLLATSRLDVAPEKMIHLEFPLDGEWFRSAARVAFIGPDMRDDERGLNRIGLEFMAVPTRSRRALERYLAALPGPASPAG